MTDTISNAVDDSSWTFQDASRHRATLAGICVDLAEISQHIAEIGEHSSGRVIDCTESQLSALGDRITDDVFRLMVIGHFNVGKSTVINTLLGEPVLPVSAIPSTAVITEVRWGELPSALLYSNGDASPKQVSLAELKKELTIPHSTPDRPSPYSRAEIDYPAQICRDGVRIVDSPGLEEHRERERLTDNYLLTADAIVFVQDANKYLSLPEVRYLTTRLADYDPFFVFTRADVVDVEQRVTVEEYARQRLRAIVGVDRRLDGRTFFVDARSTSGIAELATGLEKYLTRERHRDKIRGPARSLRSAAAELSKVVLGQLGSLDLETTELAARYDDAEAPLHELQLDVHRIAAKLDTRISDLRDVVRSRIDRELRKLATQLLPLVAEANPETRLSVVPWQVKSTVESYAKEVAEHVASALEVTLATWVRETLQPEIVERVNDIIIELDANVAKFEADLASVQVSLDGVARTAIDQADDGDSPLNRLLLGIGGWMVAGPAGGILGARFGAIGIVRAILPAVLIGAAWMLTPLGLPTLICALVVQALIQSQGMLSKAREKINQTIAREMESALKIQAAESAEKAAEEFVAVIEPLRDDVTRALEQRIIAVRGQVESTLATKRRGERAVAERRTALQGYIQRLEAAHNGLTEVIDEIAML